MSRRPVALLALAISSFAFIACSDASVTEPTSSRMAPQSAHRDMNGDTTSTTVCMSGYVVSDITGTCVPQ